MKRKQGRNAKVLEKTKRRAMSSSDIPLKLCQTQEILIPSSIG